MCWAFNYFIYSNFQILFSALHVWSLLNCFISNPNYRNICSDWFVLFHTLLGSCSSILCYLLLPGRIDWNEIPLFHPRIFNTKMFRKVTDVCSLHAPITETIPELIHTILPRWSITSKICFFTRLYIYVNCIFRAIELHAEPGLIRAGRSTCAYLYQPTGQSPHRKLFVNFEFWVHTCFKNNSK